MMFGMTEAVGQVALITGSASGIGRGIARAFVESGSRVVIADIDERKGAETAAMWGDDRARLIRADVTREDDVAAMIKYALDTFGRLDCLVNNAGNLGVTGLVQDLDIAAYRRTMDLLLTSVVMGTKHVVPVFIRSGRGSIINIASIAGMRGDPQGLTYTAAKAGVMGFTRATALQLAPNGIRVNAIAPGGIVTPVYEKIINWGPGGYSEQKLRALLERQQPLKRAGEPEDIGHMAVFLASDRARFITGQSFAVDGGLTAVMSAAVADMRAGSH
jgi:NAD(P)-dependent dehydrogenase (short-subunit alcohol dehydrogenase family)